MRHGKAADIHSDSGTRICENRKCSLSIGDADFSRAETFNGIQKERRG